jgi:hypothetical protein
LLAKHHDFQFRHIGPDLQSQKEMLDFVGATSLTYLMEKANAESGFDADASSRTSSATGLYQFIESTWLGMVRDHGDKYGLGEYAKHIDSRGRVDDPAIKKEILELRKDPEKASLLAAEFAADNKEYLETHTNLSDEEIGSTELYLAHFLGAGGATSFLNAHEKNPLARAADIFPKAANANYNVFYDSKTGKPRTLAGVYEFFDKKFQAGEGNAPARVAEGNASRYAENARTLMKGQTMEGTPDEDTATERFVQDGLALSSKRKAQGRRTPPPMASRTVTEPASETPGYAQRAKNLNVTRMAAQPALPRNSLVINPAELMILARLDAPAERKIESHRFND